METESRPYQKANGAPSDLAIYLRDHFAGAVAGDELAKRMLGSNQGNELGRFLESELIPWMAEAKDTHLKMMKRLDIEPAALKNAVGWLGEKAGRLKPNGRLRGYSPVARVIELDALTMAVSAKICTWQSLSEIASFYPEIDASELGELITAARHQLEQLETWRRWAADRAFLPSA